MNLRELSAHLERECYQPSVYHIGSGWSACGDTFCIDQVNGRFEVFYVERGERGETFHCCESESAACDAFLATLDLERFSRAHCVGFFNAKSAADGLSERLRSIGITVHRDAIPYNGVTDLRYRVFVFGRDKLLAQGMIDRENPPSA